jgi:type IX secretion system membrane protein PorP/SprF
MILKIIKLTFLFFFLTYMANAQYVPLVYLDYNNIITSSDAFFDKKDFNPSYSGDSMKFKVNFKKMNYWLGYLDSKDLTGFSLERYSKKTRSGLGLTYYYDQDFFISHVFKFDYNYRFKIKDKLNVRIATSVGLKRYKLELPLLTTEPDPLLNAINSTNNQPLFSLGTLLNYKNHELGITYSDILNFDINPSALSNPKVFKDYLVLNYNYNFKLSESIILTPELINYWNPDLNFWILKTSVSFNERIHAGLLVRSDDNLGLMFGGRPWKRLLAAYMFTFRLNNTNQTGIEYGISGINISYMLF